MAVTNVRLLQREEMAKVKRLSDAENWNMELEYLQTGHDLSPERWFCAEDEKGNIIGSCVAIPLNDSTAIFAIFNVEKSHRGKGIGKQLWRAAKNSAGDRNLVLYATDVNIYNRDGFQPSYEVKILFWQKQGSINLPLTSDTKFRIFPYTDVDISDIEQFDARVKMIPASKYFRDYILGCCYSGFVATDNSSGDVIGYGCLRRGANVWKMFPLYAETDDVARELLRALLNVLPDDEIVYAGAFSANQSGISMLRDVGFSGSSFVTFMYNKLPVDLKVQNIYSVSTLDFAIC